jgi:hypothetical protein
MVIIVIDGKEYEVDEQVQKRMQEYYDTMNKAIEAYKLLNANVKQMRLYQADYFASKNSPKFIRNERLLRSKEAEHVVDELLKGKQKKKEPEQGSLY